MKKNKIIGIILFMIMILCFETISYSFALNELTGTTTTGTEAILKDKGNSAVKIISTIGVIISVIMLIVLGIKYMLGSTEEKAEYKKSLMPYTIGAGLLFAASSIAQIIYELAINL